MPVGALILLQDAVMRKNRRRAAVGHRLGQRWIAEHIGENGFSGFGKLAVAAHEIRVRVGVDDVSDRQRRSVSRIAAKTWPDAAAVPAFTNTTPSEPICTPMFPPAPAIM